ncbi:hypothetical protein [Allocoleopsis franciscana]|nr:hypothetical protein [Allocoleopsis franciscana]
MLMLSALFGGDCAQIRCTFDQARIGIKRRSLAPAIASDPKNF